MKHQVMKHQGMKHQGMKHQGMKHQGMNAIILQGTLKKDGRSNTQVLAEFFAGKLAEQDVECEIIRLAQHAILPGTYQDMGEGDAWPGILKKILAADLIIFATPIWWSSHSSELQRVIERLDAIHDDIQDGKASPLAGKAAGVLITGDSDGAQHIIGVLANFFNAIGLSFPPYSSLSVLSESHEKDADTPRATLLKEYEQDYAETAETMVENLKKACAAMKG